MLGIHGRLKRHYPRFAKLSTIGEFLIAPELVVLGCRRQLPDGVGGNCRRPQLGVISDHPPATSRVLLSDHQLVACVRPDTEIRFAPVSGRLPLLIKSAIGGEREPAGQVVPQHQQGLHHVLVVGFHVRLAEVSVAARE